jgi:hypothetical protein
MSCRRCLPGLPGRLSADGHCLRLCSVPLLVNWPPGSGIGENRSVGPYGTARMHCHTVRKLARAFCDANLAMRQAQGSALPGVVTVRTARTKCFASSRLKDDDDRSEGTKGATSRRAMYRWPRQRRSAPPASTNPAHAFALRATAIISGRTIVARRALSVSAAIPRTLRPVQTLSRGSREPRRSRPLGT